MPSASQHSSPSTGSSSRMPALLEPHVVSGSLTRTKDSLTVLTWVQGATANWLVLRYLHALLGSGRESGGSGDEEEVAGVVLVSFLRDGRFWAEACMRLGMDLDTLRKSGRFAFVDGLSGLHTTTATQTPPLSSSSIPTHNGDNVITGSSSSSGQVDAIKTQIDAALSRLSCTKKVLLVDGLDVYVAMTQPGSVSAAETLLMNLRENVFSTLLTLAVDEPLMQAAQHQHQQGGGGSGGAGGGAGSGRATTALEREHAVLVLGQAHAADQVISLRRLDTGAAADVSGVMRITTRGDGGDAGGSGGGDDQGEELLYHVSGDGSVRVFERGA